MAKFRIGGNTRPVKIGAAVAAPKFTPAAEPDAIVPGSTTPESWTQTAIGDTLSLAAGGTLTIQASYGNDTYFNDQKPAARFVTTLYNDVDDLEYIDLISHPYNGVIVDGSSTTANSITVYMSCNNGDWHEATTRTASNGCVYHSVQAPSSLSVDTSGPGYGFAEVRAVVIPANGAPVILQQDPFFEFDGNDEKRHESVRGVFMSEYTSVTISNLSSTSISSLVTTHGKNVRAVVTDATRVNLQDWLHVDSSHSFGEETIPILDGIKYKASTGGVANAYGTIVANGDWTMEELGSSEELFNKISVDTAGTTPCFIFKSCSFSVAKDTTYQYSSDSNSNKVTLNTTEVSSATQDIIDAGFGVFVQYYLHDLKPSDIGMKIVNGSGGVSVFLDGCTFKYQSLNCKEAIDTICENPVWNNDVWNAGLLVNAEDYYVNSTSFPYGTSGADEIINDGGYDYDYKANALKELVTTNAARLTARNNVFSFSGTPTKPPTDLHSNEATLSNYSLNGNGTASGGNWSWKTGSGYSETNNSLISLGTQGIWPVWIVGSGGEMDRDKRGLCPTQDHLGNTFDAWPWQTWGAEAFNPHLDITQLGPNYQSPGSVIATKLVSTGPEVARQGLFWHQSSELNSAAVWDCTFSDRTNVAAYLSTGSGSGQHWGPSVKVYEHGSASSGVHAYGDWHKTPIGSTRDGNPKSFSYVDDPDFPIPQNEYSSQAASAGDYAYNILDKFVDVDSARTDLDPRLPSNNMTQAVILGEFTGTNGNPADRRVVFVNNIGTGSVVDTT